MQNLHRRFDRYYIGQIYGGDFAKICGLLRIYELYLLPKFSRVSFTIVLIPLTSTMVNGTLLNFGKRYEDD